LRERRLQGRIVGNVDSPGPVPREVLREASDPGSAEDGRDLVSEGGRLPEDAERVAARFPFVILDVDERRQSG
jgi:hypothetical protein